MIEEIYNWFLSVIKYLFLQKSSGRDLRKSHLNHFNFIITLLFLLLFTGYGIFGQNYSKKEKILENFKNINPQLIKNNPDSVLKIARKILVLPAKVASNKDKYIYFKSLADEFEKSGNYKQSVFFYKTADSLLTAKNNYIPVKKKPPLPIGLYLFLFSLAAFFVVLFYGIIQIRRLQKETDLKKDEFNKFKTSFLNIQNKLEDDLNKENVDLISKINKLQEKEAELKTELKKAEEAAYLRNAFVANLGFDVRTPLNGIIGFANMLETELALKEDKEFFEYAASIEKSGNRLLKMLNNVIDLSSLEANALELSVTSVSVNEIIQNVYQQYQPLAKEKNIIFKSKTDSDLSPVLADKEALRKSVIQVVDNALRFTQKGFVTLSAIYYEDKESGCIEVKDTGPGIDNKKISLLLKEDIIETEQIKYDQGTGTGLKLVKKFIELMKGDLQIDSQPGKGTSVKIILPCSNKPVIERKDVNQHKEPVSDVNTEITIATEIGDLDVFVVEDDRMNRLILEKMLQKMGKVKLAVDGDDCMHIIDEEAAKGHYFQVMLFDINLPGDWDGVKLMKEIRNKYPKYRDIPFIAQTAYAMAGDKDRFLREGFDSYLSKPINKNELITTIRQQLYIHKSIK